MKEFFKQTQACDLATQKIEIRTMGERWWDETTMPTPVSVPA
jgi:hypothetical protein